MLVLRHFKPKQPRIPNGHLRSPAGLRYSFSSISFLKQTCMRSQSWADRKAFKQGVGVRVYICMYIHRYQGLGFLYVDASISCDYGLRV